jgi:hypothetical protein
VSRTRIPDEVLAAAHARSRARSSRQWSEADRLRAEIEAAGWTVVDRGTDFALSPTHPPDVEEGGRVRYGSVGSIPSRLDEAPVGLASVILVVPSGSSVEDASRTLRSVVESAPAGTDVVVVAEEASSADVTALEGVAVKPRGVAMGEGSPDTRDTSSSGATVEVLATTAAFGAAEARNAGIRRAAAPAVVLIDVTVAATGDFVSQLVDALAEPSVGVAGAWGLATRDLRRWEAAGPGNVDAVEGSCVAFRRADYAERGPLDGRFRVDAYLDVWWSLVLRDEPEGAHRRALALPTLPVTRTDRGDDAGSADLERAVKRNFYRLIERFGARRDLLTGE